MLGRSRLAADHVDHRGRMEVGEVEQEVVRTDHVEPERAHRPDREVTHVRGHDRVGASSQRCRDHMAIVGVVAQHDSLDQRLPTRDCCVLERTLHRSDARVDLGRGDVRMDGQHGRTHLGEDPLGPQRAVQTGVRSAQERVRQRDGHEDACVEECSEAHPFAPLPADDRRARRSASA